MPLTPEELALGFDRFPMAGQRDSGENIPDEENAIAARDIDPRFGSKVYLPSAGCLCTL